MRECTFRCLDNNIKLHVARLSCFYLRCKTQQCQIVWFPYETFFAKVEPQLWLVLPRCKTQVASLLYDTAATFLPTLALPLSSFARQLSNSRPRHAPGCACARLPLDLNAAYSGSRKLQNLDLESWLCPQLQRLAISSPQQIRLELLV